jgi:hypothetical protein
MREDVPVPDIRQWTRELKLKESKKLQDLPENKEEHHRQRVDQLKREIQVIAKEVEGRESRSSNYVMRLDRDYGHWAKEWKETPYFKVAYRNSRLAPEGEISMTEVLVEPKALLPNQVQDIVFLIDRSRFMGRETYHVVKEALSEVLSILPKEQRFQVVFFDKNTLGEGISAQALNKESLTQTYDYIDHVRRGGLFASSDLFKSLMKHWKMRKSDPDRLYTYIVVTQGKRAASASYLKQQIEELFKTPLGNTSLYTLVVDSSQSGQREAQIDLLTSLLGGAWMQAYSDEEVKNKLLVLVKSVLGARSRQQAIRFWDPKSGDEVYAPGKEEVFGPIYDPLAKRFIFQTPENEDIKMFVQWLSGNQWYDLSADMILSKVSQENKEVGHYWKVRQLLTQLIQGIIQNDQGKLKLARIELGKLQYPLPL